MSAHKFQAQEAVQRRPGETLDSASNNGAWNVPFIANCLEMSNDSVMQRV
jgi:hypothetical protein